MQTLLPLSDLKREWLDQAERQFLGITRFKFMPFTTDDLHGVLTEPEHKNWLGVLVAKLKNKGLIQRIGYQPSQRPESNGRVIALWKRTI
jgi:hypothetical protein